MRTLCRSGVLQALSRHSPRLVEKLGQLDSGLLDPDTINEMRDAVGSELVNEGLNTHDEPNKYGLHLENLINRLASLYLWPELDENE